MWTTFRPRSRTSVFSPFSHSSLAAQPPEIPEPTTMASKELASGITARHYRLPPREPRTPRRMERESAEPALRAALLAMRSTRPSCLPPLGPVVPKIKPPSPPNAPLDWDVVAVGAGLVPDVRPRPDAGRRACFESR